MFPLWHADRCVGHAALGVVDADDALRHDAAVGKRHDTDIAFHAHVDDEVGCQTRMNRADVALDSTRNCSVGFRFG